MGRTTRRRNLMLQGLRHALLSPEAVCPDLDACRVWERDTGCIFQLYPQRFHKHAKTLLTMTKAPCNRPPFLCLSWILSASQLAQVSPIDNRNFSINQARSVENR